jgi:hypothetical protein
MSILISVSCRSFTQSNHNEGQNTMDPVKLQESYRSHFGTLTADMCRTAAELLGLSAHLAYRAAALGHMFLRSEDGAVRPPAHLLETPFCVVGGALLAASKVECAPTKLRSLTIVVDRLRRRREGRSTAGECSFEEFDHLKTAILDYEMRILEANGLVTSVQLPHTLAIIALRFIYASDDDVAADAEEDLCQAGRHVLERAVAHCNDAMRCDALICDTPAPTIAAAAVSLALKQLEGVSLAEQVPGWHAVLGKTRDDKVSAAEDLLQHASLFPVNDLLAKTTTQLTSPPPAIAAAAPVAPVQLYDLASGDDDSGTDSSAFNSASSAFDSGSSTGGRGELKRDRRAERKKADRERRDERRGAGKEDDREKRRRHDERKRDKKDERERRPDGERKRDREDRDDDRKRREERKLREERDDRRPREQRDDRRGHDDRDRKRDDREERKREDDRPRGDDGDRKRREEREERKSRDDKRPSERDDRDRKGRDERDRGDDRKREREADKRDDRGQPERHRDDRRDDGRDDRKREERPRDERRRDERERDDRGARRDDRDNRNDSRRRR